MGNATSDSSNDGSGDGNNSPFASIPEDERHGWKVLQVIDGSPCASLGIVPYFFVLTHIDGCRAPREDHELVPLIRPGVRTELRFLDLSSLMSRTASVVPRRGWGASASDEVGLLGLMIRFEPNWGDAHLETIHVLDVHAGSPAQAAGLRAHRDYLLGDAKIAFKNWESLDLWLTQHQYDDSSSSDHTAADRARRSLGASLLVFDRDLFSVRSVLLRPSAVWGGLGSLGCDVGIGYLHALPIDGRRQVRNETQADAAAAANKSEKQPRPIVVDRDTLMRLLPLLSETNLSSLNPTTGEVQLNIIITDASSPSSFILIQLQSGIVDADYQSRMRMARDRQAVNDAERATIEATIVANAQRQLVIDQQAAAEKLRFESSFQQQQHRLEEHQIGLDQIKALNGQRFVSLQEQQQSHQHNGQQYGNHMPYQQNVNQQSSQPQSLYQQHPPSFAPLPLQQQQYPQPSFGANDGASSSSAAAVSATSTYQPHPTTFQPHQQSVMADVQHEHQQQQHQHWHQYQQEPSSSSSSSSSHVDNHHHQSGHHARVGSNDNAAAVGPQFSSAESHEDQQRRYEEQQHHHQQQQREQHEHRQQQNVASMGPLQHYGHQQNLTMQHHIDHSNEFHRSLPHGASGASEVETSLSSSHSDTVLP